MQTGLRRKKQRIMAIMLVIMLVAGMLPSTSFAEEDTQTKIEQTQKVLNRKSTPQTDTQQEVLQRKSAPQIGTSGNALQTGMLQIGASGDTSSEGYVVTVEDTDGTALEDASVEYEVVKSTTTPPIASGSVTTNKDGKAVLTALADIASDIENAIGATFTLKLKITMDGYYEQEISVPNITSVTGNKEVNLTKAYVVTVTDATGKNKFNDEKVNLNYKVIKTTSGSGGSVQPDIIIKETKAEIKDGQAILTALADKKSEIEGQSGVSLELWIDDDYYTGTKSVNISSITGTAEFPLTYKKVSMTITTDSSQTAILNNISTNVKIGDKSGCTAEVDKNTKVTVSIKPADGYRVAKVKNGSTEVTNTDSSDGRGFTGEITVGESDVTLQVEFEEVWEVTVTVGDHGALDKSSTCKAGTVYVLSKQEKTVTLVPVAADGYCIDKITVTKNGVTEEIDIDRNEVTKTVEETIKGDTTFDICFTKKKYTVTIEKTGDYDDNCKVTLDGYTPVKSENGTDIFEVEHGTELGLTLVPGPYYEKPEIKMGDKTISCKCTDIAKDVYKPNTSTPLTCTSDMKLEVSYFKVTSVTADAKNPLETDYYSTKKPFEYIRYIPAADAADGRITYVLSEDINTSVTFEPDGNYYNLILDGDKYQSEFVLQLNYEKDIDTICLKNFKNNAKYNITDLNLRFVLDNKVPEVNIVLPNAPTGYYNQNVDFTVQVTEQDEGKCSGIASVKYWIVSNGKTTKEETLYEYKNGDEILDTFNHSIQINAAENNYDGVEIYVEVTDRAGNVKEKVETINIDATPPQVSLTYDNNNSYKNSKYFNATRTATIVVKEREDNFDHAKATEGIVITAKDANNQDVADAYTIGEWHTQRNHEDDNLTTHTATIMFSEDANYTLAMHFQDIAGNPNAPIVTGDSVAPYDFTVDTKAPTGTLTAKSKEGRSSTWEKLITDLKFGYYSKAKITLSGTFADETSLVSAQYYKQVQAAGAAELKALSVSDLDSIMDWKSFEGFSVSQDEKFVVYLKITDSAGNYTYISTNGLIVDEHAPVKEVFEPKVTIEPEQPVNGYYNKDVTVKLKVEDPEVNGTYTGLKEISYKVYNESVSKTEPTQKEELLSFAVKNPAQSDLVQNWEGKIKVDSGKNNSNNIVVEVYAEDNAGNGVTYTKKLKIDTTAPIVNVRYSNNNAASDKYFNAARTATIEVTERNFDVNDMNIKITNTDGAAPKVSGWKQTKGTGNGDDTKWTATINYVQDGDYTFDISYKDRAGNKSSINYVRGTVSAKEFTIDATKPTVNVSYDNNNVHNGEYYNLARRATVSVTEHNFDPQRVETVISATENGAAVAAPTISGWSTNGDVHTATVSYANDARYTFDISVTDMAGNAAADFAEQSFYVDQTVPELQITGVKDQSANAGDVIPVITYSDANFDINELSIALTGANRKEVKPDGSYSNGSMGGSFTFNNFAKTQDVDDIYVLSAALTDRAGNTVSEEITFSVNRFGSTYDFSDRTEQINGSYIQASEDIVVVETNPTKLTDIKVTLFQNNETLLLTEGQDYDIRQAGGNGQWYYYTYTVYKDVFQEDGIYKLVLHSKDGAENISENILETKDAEISFGVDKTKPNIVVANLDSKQTYAVDNMTVIMSASDNLKLTEVMVYLDDSLHAEWKDESLETMLDQSGDLTFDIPGTSNHAHKVRIICRDAAGNEAVQEITGFYVTTNLWVRYYNNKPLFYGSILGMLVVAGWIVFIVVKRRKKEEA